MSPILNATHWLITDAHGFYEWTLTLADSRTKGWLLVDSPMPTILCTALYLIIVCLGPRIMRDRKPFELTRALIPYNLAMAGLNFYIAFELIMASTELKYNYACQPIRMPQHPQELRIVNAVWWYYFSKLLEFCDTFFVILRKKDIQLTFLHVYHHASMFLYWWFGIKWVPSGSTFLPAMINSCIHVLMYSYYGLSALGPKVEKYLWWKKYLTILQLIQFITGMTLGINALTIECDFPKWIHYTFVIYMTSFLMLFGNFYAKVYIKKGREAFYGKTNAATYIKSCADKSL